MKLTGTAAKSVKHIVQATFPDYTGRKLFLQPRERAPKELQSYWDEGSRTYYAFYNLDTHEVLQVGSNHPFYEPQKPTTLRELPEHIVLVSRAIHWGKETGVTLYGHLQGLFPI